MTREAGIITVAPSTVSVIRGLSALPLDETFLGLKTEVIKFTLD